MNLSAPDYKSLYKLQDKVLQVLAGHLGRFYLTGGTALGRFYLHHRFSDDLDFFLDNGQDFTTEVERFNKLLNAKFNINTKATVFTQDFVRLWISEDIAMKVEFVNDTGEYWGQVREYKGIFLDNPGNVLANKIGAMLSRDEAKDVFDIVTIADHFSFNWKTVYEQATRKQLMNEEDVLMRLTTFPVTWLPEQRWIKGTIDMGSFRQKLDRIAGDFLLARDNSLGAGKIPIEKAMPASI